MKNVIGECISTIRKGVDFLDESYNFSVPGIVNHIVRKKNNGKLEVKVYDGYDSEEKLKINTENCRWYIGKIFKKKANIYSKKSFWIGSMGYLFKKLEKGEKLTIVMAPSVSKICNGAEDVKGVMSIEEQEDYIRGIIKISHRKYVNRLNIVNIESYHKDLFDFLDSKGLHGLASNEGPPGKGIYVWYRGITHKKIDLCNGALNEAELSDMRNGISLFFCAGCAMV